MSADTAIPMLPGPVLTIWPQTGAVHHGLRLPLGALQAAGHWRSLPGTVAVSLGGGLAT